MDSSALVKLVIEEPESAALADHLDRDQTVLATSELATVEVSRAARLANPSEDVQAAVDALLGSCLLVSLTSPLLRVARSLASASVRTLDAIHLATALRVEADELLAYDRRLLAAARGQGLSVVSP